MIFLEHGEKENDSIAKGVYVRKCVGSHPVGQLWERLFDTVKD